MDQQNAIDWRSAEQTVLSFLTSVAGLGSDKLRRRRYKNAEALLLRHGRFWSASGPSAQPRLRPANHCFTNAFHLLHERPDVYYVEGYYYEPGLVPLEHAWCVTRGGQVMDPTCRNPLSTLYFGVALKSGYVRRTVIRSGMPSVLWNHEARFPMLTDDEDEWREPAFAV